MTYRNTFSLSALVAVLVAFVFACDTGTGVDTDDAPSVDSVDEVSYDTSTADDSFDDDFDDETKAPEDEGEAAALLAALLQEFGDDLSSSVVARQDDESVADELNALFEGEPFTETETGDESDYRYTLEGLGSETVEFTGAENVSSGEAEFTLDLDIDFQQSMTETQWSIDTENAMEASLDLVEQFELSDNGDVIARLPAGFAGVATNLNAAAEFQMGDDGQITSGQLAYSSSLGYWLAFSLEAKVDVDDDGDKEWVGAHFYIVLEYTDDQAVSGASQEDLAEEFEQAIDDSGALDLTVKAWDEAPNDFDEEGTLIDIQEEGASFDELEEIFDEDVSPSASFSAMLSESTTNR